MECQICYEHFDSKSFIPKILVKCGHSFCKICVERMIKDKITVQCPICREITKIGKKESLPTNYSLSEIIEKSTDYTTSKNLLERYKYFDEKYFKNVCPVINRYHEPKKLNLKKIINNDFIFIEEFENNQNYSLFNNLPKRNRRYNFNRNSYFAYLFTEYSYTIFMYRKASKCKHSYSCLEYLIKKISFWAFISFLAKYPIRGLMFYLFKLFGMKPESEELSKYTFAIQFVIGGVFSSLNIFKCMIGFYIDDILKLK